MVKKLTIKSKIWIADEEAKVVFGLGRLRILDAIERHGSIHAAASELRMSYRAVWCRIKATESRLGKALVTSRTGGTGGGGSELTPYAKSVLEHFRELQKEINQAADDLFQSHFARELITMEASESAENTADSE